MASSIEKRIDFRLTFDNIMKVIFDYIKEYKLEIIMALCLFSNLYPDLPHFLYYALIFVILIYAKRLGAVTCSSRKIITFGLIGIIFISSIFSGHIDFRFILMSFLLYISLGISSYDYYLFKVRFLYICLIGFGITSILNYYAALRGINYQLIMGIHAGELFTHDFSGFTFHPMWLSAASGVGTIFFVYVLVRLWNSDLKRKWVVFILPLVFASFIVTVKGGSRAAAGISIMASCLMIYIGSKRVSNIFAIVMALAIITSFVAPVIIENSERMQTKYGGLSLRDKDGKTSRTKLWNDRMEEFGSSPLWGVGFGVSGIGTNAKVGRVETGSGWLTVLSQTGIIGLLLSLFAVKKSFIPISVLRENSKMNLFFVVLIYFCLHSIFEAYMFQSGWYMCLLFWMLVGVLDDFKDYGSPDEILDEEES